MATVLDPHYRARLEALAEKYADGVPAQMQAIGAALAACQGGGAAALVALHRLLHAVAGSAGTFGHAALGQECRRLEQQLRPLMDGAADAMPWPALAAQVARLLAWAAVDPRAARFPGADE